MMSEGFAYNDTLSRFADVCTTSSFGYGDEGFGRSGCRVARESMT